MGVAIKVHRVPVVLHPTTMSTFKERYAEFYRDATTARGINYHLLAIEPQAGKATLLFLHGFPSHSNDWHYQIEYFHKKGYGIIAPDLLGYGGTDQPLDADAYNWKKMSTDIIDVLDTIAWLKTDTPARLIGVGHDWGSVLLARLAFWYPQRFTAFAFLTVGIIPPQSAPFDFEAALVMSKQYFGAELPAYQEFFVDRADAAEVIQKNFDSFVELFWPEKAELWKEYITVRGMTEDWIRTNKRGTRASWLTEEDYEATKANLLKGGLAAPLNWYKSHHHDLNLEDEKPLVGKVEVQQPVLLITAKRDYVGLPTFHSMNTQQLAKNLIIKELDSGHWVYWEKPDEVNEELDTFFDKVLV